MPQKLCHPLSRAWCSVERLEPEDLPSEAAATEDEVGSAELEVYEEGGLLDIYKKRMLWRDLSQAEMPILVSFLVLDLDLTICCLDCKFE